MFEVIGKIIKVGEVQSGTSAAGKEWAKKEYVLETTDKYPKQIAFTVFGVDKVKSVSAEAGDMVNLKFEVNSREWQGRWFTNIDAQFIDPAESAESQPAAKDTKTKKSTKAAPKTEFKESEPEDDLPF